MTPSRLRILENGALEIVDPRFEDLPLLLEVDPGFSVLRTPLPGFTAPRFQAMRRIGCGISIPELERMDIDGLWLAHNSALQKWTSGADDGECSPGQASLLTVKVELARRLLRGCTLCARRCGVNRLAGQRGYCGLGSNAIVAECFTHIGEEAPINPSFVISLAGCALRCRYCQQSAILYPARVGEVELTSALWKDLDFSEARTVSFVGGNPDESIFAILQFLNSAPPDFELPIVWNSHAYSTPESMALLHGVVDAYLPDFKYSSPACGARWSKVEDYPVVARKTITQMTSQNVPVIVRILLLPGHFQCCHLPALRFLASLSIPPFVSIRGQYCPDWQITDSDGEMATRIAPEEGIYATALARSLGLAVIGSS
jgi:putative pyruvate formate lyase activating enzyme